MVRFGVAVDDLVQVYNPWLAFPERQAELLAQRLPDPFVERSVSVHPRPGRVTLVVGPRQAGKSTLLMDMARRQPRPVVVLNVEEPAIRTLCHSPGELAIWLQRSVGDEAFVILEEAQHLDEPGLFLKGLVDLRSRHLICATGSSSYHLRARTRESLAGRAERVKLLPFSLDELVGQTPNALSRRTRGAEVWKRQLRFGGYPSIWSAPQPEAELARLAEAFVLRDASDLYAVRDLGAFRILLGFIAADAGSLVNVSGWANEAGVSRDTINRWVELLVETHLVVRLRPFLGGKRAELKSTTKVFFLDCGLRNALFGGFGPADNRADRGALAETWVLGEVAKATGLLDTVRFWRTRHGAEVDFVVDRGATRIAIEVKAGALKRPTLSRAARTFIELYAPARFVVVNAELEADAEHAGVPVHFRPPWALRAMLEA